MSGPGGPASFTCGLTNWLQVELGQLVSAPPGLAGIVEGLVIDEDALIECNFCLSEGVDEINAQHDF